MADNIKSAQITRGNVKEMKLNKIITAIKHVHHLTIYDHNIWRIVHAMDHFDPQHQWKYIIDLDITELFHQLPIDNEVLEYLGLNNHQQLITGLIARDTQNVLSIDSALLGACEGGQMELAQWCVDKGATHFNSALHGACQGGSMELAQWCVDKGATDFNWALHGACQGGTMEMAQWCVDKGATDFNFALRGACQGGRFAIAKWAVDKGANDFNEALQYTSDETIEQWLQKLINT
jgi:hypothetical protein